MLNPMRFHPMAMDPMIFELKAGVYATSLYLLLCSHIDEGVQPTLNRILPTWNGSRDDLALAVKELGDLRVLEPMDGLDYDRRLFVNPREKWSWCRKNGTNGAALNENKDCRV